MPPLELLWDFDVSQLHPHELYLFDMEVWITPGHHVLHNGLPLPSDPPCPHLDPYGFGITCIHRGFLFIHRSDLQGQTNKV